MKIVLIEDDVKLAELLTSYLENNEFEVHLAHDGLQASSLILQVQPDLVILDLMLPGLDGLSICREIRNDYKGKIVFLTASDDDIDHVAALELGADDFVNKPIKPRVLLARIRMLLRRQQQTELAHPDNDHQLHFGQLSINHKLRQCSLAGEDIVLTDSEFDLLWLLASHAEQVLSREYLVKETRGIEYDGLDRTIDNKVAILRRKLGDSSSVPKRILTLRGKGYLFVPESWS